MDIDILYEDNHLIAVNKKSGELVQGDKTRDEPLCDKVKAYLKEKGDKPGEAFIGVIHRLDRPVSGVVIFAKTSKALVRMNKLFEEKQIQKSYWAVVKERPPVHEDTLIHYIAKDEEKNKAHAYSREKKGAKYSELSYHMNVSLYGKHLLDIYPKTGRPHQIRIQLATIGCPIVGDLKYGYPKPMRDKSICLHAKSIAFIHPVKDEKIRITTKMKAENFIPKV